MMRRLAVGLLSLLVASTAGIAGTIGYEVTSLGGDLYRYSYTFNDFDLSENQEIDIRFDPIRFGTLSNPVAPPEFDVLVLQPNNPPGAMGDFALLALIDDPPLDGLFTIDVRYLGTGLPGSQRFVINEYSPSGLFLRSTEAGSTVKTGAVPEPSTLLLFSSAAVALYGRARRRQSR